MIQTEDSLEILEVPGQAEGESGSETIGFSTFGSQRINDAQKRRARPTSVTFRWNMTLNAAQAVTPLPAAYWGTFITTFDGAILGGARNDGLGASVGWAQLFTAPNLKESDGIGGNAGVPTTTNTTIGLPGSLCGFDVFIDTLQTNIGITIDNVFNPYTASSVSIPVVVAKVPQIGSYIYPSAPAGTPPVAIIRRRPEGYTSNEDGAQVFLTLPYASNVFPLPPGFVDPTTIPGLPFTNIIPRILVGITP